MNHSARSARGALAVVLLLLLVGASASWGGERATASSGPGPRLHVSGSRLLDARGRRLELRGVNRSGTEYACIQGWGLFDGPNDDASVRALASWHVNFVRVLLNEDCWLGINGVKQAYAGQAYRQAITNYVALLHRYGIYVEVSLMWGAPGRYRATYQPAAPDKDHSPAMWASMAATFKGDPNVLLAPWGETLVRARCFLRGGLCGATYGRSKRPYRSAGMQQAVNVMRRAGYRGVIVIPGTHYANEMRPWLSHEPRDPLHQLIAEAHVYGKNSCSSVACFDRTMAPLARHVPLIFGETGETYDASSCDSRNISTFLHWADRHNVGYATWTWDTWGTCEALISDYGGTPAHRYGAFVNSYLSQNAGSTHLLGS